MLALKYTTFVEKSLNSVLWRAAATNALERYKSRWHERKKGDEGEDMEMEGQPRPNLPSNSKVKFQRSNEKKVTRGNWKREFQIRD